MQRRKARAACGGGGSAAEPRRGPGGEAGATATAAAWAAGGGAETTSEILGIARGGGLNLLGQVCGQVAALGATMLLAWRLGTDDVGRYAQAFAFLSLLGLLSLSGFRSGLTRFVAVHLAEGDPLALRATVRLGIGLTTAVAVVLALGLHLAAPWLARAVFHDAGLLPPLRAVALALPAATFTDSALAATQGFRTMRPFALIGLVFEPLALVAGSAALLAADAGLEGVMTALVAANLAAAALAAVALWRLLRMVPAPAQPHAGPCAGPHLGAHAGAGLRELFGFSLVSWGASLASAGLIWADTILLGAMRSSAEVGVYNVATRLVTLATFVMPAINSALGPRIANLYHRGRHDSLHSAYTVATSWIVRLSLPAFIALLAFPGELLRLFGGGFGAGAAVTAILAAGKLVDAATGPCGLMLNMSGRPLWSMIDNLAVLVLNVALNLWLIPSHGIAGAAIAWSVSLGAVNLARVVQVWSCLRMLPFDVGVLKGILAGAAALAAGLAAHRLLGSLDAWDTVTLALVLIVEIYLGLVAVLGIGPEDRLVLESLLRRSRGGPFWSGLRGTTT